MIYSRIFSFAKFRGILYYLFEHNPHIMKKTLTAFVLIITFGFSFQTADAFTSKYANFWAELFGHKFSNQNSAKKSYTPSYSSKNTRRSRFSSRLSDRRTRFSRNSFSRRSFGLSSRSNSPSLLATISSTASDDNIYEVNETPINIFKLGVRNNTRTASSKFPANIMLDQAEFQLFSKNGIFDDPRDFDLVVNDEAFSFDEAGKVTLRFNNARLAEGENLELDIAIKADDPNNMAHQNGSAKLRLLNISAYKEFSRDSVPVQVKGNRISKRISYSPLSVVTGGGNSTIVSTSGSSIYSDIITAGEEKYVLAVSMNAAYDDLGIRKIKIRNNYGNSIDSQIEEVQAVNLLTGELLGTSMFTNGEARFQFSPRVIIARNDRGKIGFKVKARENPRNNGDRRLKITLFPSDVVVESMSNGRELPDSNKNFSIDSYDFLVLESELEISSTNQPNNFAIGTGSPEGVYNFKISNNSRNSAELGRISLDAYPSGLEFNGGSISADDFELVGVYGNREESTSTTASVLGNKVVFDFTNPLSIYRNSAKNFRLKVALNESGTSSSNDGVSVRISTGDSYINNSLATVRGTGANFIWSDESAGSHSTTSDDWFSGYRLDIPSSSTYIKR